MSNVFDKLNSILQNVELDDVSADSQSYSQLPDGYYLVEVEKAELKETKETAFPMASIQFKIVENGVDIDLTNNSILKKELNGTKNRKIFINWVLKDEAAVKRFVGDMLKFEKDDGQSLLTKDFFLDAELIEESLSLIIGYRIYAMVSTTEKDGKTNTWTNLISWKRAKALELE